MKKRMFYLDAVDEVTIYTGNHGKAGCSCRCPGCSQTTYGSQHIHCFHQGTIGQIKELISLLPNLKKAYFLGNPDCSVDPKFCSEAAKLFIEKGIHVMFSTSGIGGKVVIQELTSGLDLSYVEYISFSVDSIDPATESLLKGRKINYANLLKGIEYCKSIGVPVKIQPTVWQLNQNHCLDLLNFFHRKYDIDWFTFHVGSLEGIHPHNSEICKHVLPDEWHKTAEQILAFSKQEQLRTAVPLIFLTADEYRTYEKTYLTHCSNPTPTNLQVWLEEDTLVTFYPILSNVYPTYYTATLGKAVISNQPNKTSHLCPVQKESLGDELAKEFQENQWQKDGQTFYYACRFYKKMTKGK